MKILLEKAFNDKNIQINDEKIEKFDIFYNFLLKENEKINLTRIIEKEDVVKKHFLDSVIPEKFIPLNASVIDVGVGAGFPSIPLKIMRDDVNITMVDSVDKKVKFISSAVSLLNLKNATTLHSRVEDLAYDIKYRETFDVCVARAVAELNVLAEYCLPFVKVGGLFIAYKNVNCEAEVKRAESAIKLLGGKVEKIENYRIDLERENAVILIRKIGRIKNIYPRRNNKPRKDPL